MMFFSIGSKDKSAIRFPLRHLLCLLPLFLLSGCITEEKNYGITEMFHNRPKMVRMLPRSIIGPLPSGIFESHTPHSILVMDSGADYRGEAPLTYLTALTNRYMGVNGQGDAPVHYFIDAEGRIYIGRNSISPSELYEGDSFSLRPSEVNQQEALTARLARRNMPRLDMKGFYVIMVLGDFDRQMLTEAQEKSLFQLMANISYDNHIPLSQINGLKERFPQTNNPGFYLNNYLQSYILEANIPPSPGKHRFTIPPTAGIKR